MVGFSVGQLFNVVYMGIRRVLYFCTQKKMKKVEKIFRSAFQACTFGKTFSES